MKTISDYTIYCTEEQTKKAIELGAPIERDGYEDRPYVYIDGAYLIPTAEQMIGWLKTQGIDIEVSPEHNHYIWRAYEGFEIIDQSELEFFKSSEEATLAAIDAALEYLENLK